MEVWECGRNVSPSHLLTSLKEWDQAQIVKTYMTRVEGKITRLWHYLADAITKHRAISKRKKC
jgi:hypothetical protein